MSYTSSVTLISKSTIYPENKSTIVDLKLSVSDLPMLACHYIQKGVLLTLPPFSFDLLLSLLKFSLSQTLSHFPALSGRLNTDSHGFVHVICNDAGVDFIHANACHLSIHDILSPIDVPDSVKELFAFNGKVSYEGHFNPIMAVQVTELADGVFIGCSVNHAVADGTSFWNFFNTLSEVFRGVETISRPPDFRRNFFKDSTAVIRFTDGVPKVTFDVDSPLRERIFHFSREAILNLKSRANAPLSKRMDDGFSNDAEIMGKLSNDTWKNNDRNGKITVEISSFQSLCALLWRSVTRARKLAPSKMTTFRMAVNCRQRLEPRLDPYYFGNAIQSIPTFASAGEILSRDLCWCASLLHQNVLSYDDTTIRRSVEDWEKNPRCFPLGNLDGGSITMGSSPRFPMYDNDFGWGRPLAIRSGRANKFDGKISAFPGREGAGNVELEVCLAPDTMVGVENDLEFMQFVSKIGE